MLQDERHRAYRAVRELLELLAAGRPHVIVLDDVQWADAASAELLAALLYRPPECRLLLALAARAGQAPAPLAAALESVERRRGVQRLRLGPLAVRVTPGTWRGYEAGPEGLEILVFGAPNLGENPREDVEGQRDWWAD